MSLCLAHGRHCDPRTGGVSRTLLTSRCLRGTGGRGQGTGPSITPASSHPRKVTSLLLLCFPRANDRSEQPVKTQEMTLDGHRQQRHGGERAVDTEQGWLG